jgi:hypothetical protein
MSGALDAVGDTAGQLSFSIKDIGAAVDSAAGSVDGATSDMDGSLSAVDATATGLSERLGSIGSGASGAAGEVSGAASDMDGALSSVDASATVLADRLDTIGAGAAGAAGEVTGAAADMDTSLGSVDAAADTTATTVGGMGKKIAEALAATVVGVVYLASKYDDAVKQYVNASKNAGESSKTANATLNEAVSASANYGFTNVQTADSLETLALAHITGTKAINDLGVAENLARAKHVSLSDAVGILTKANAGSTKGLTALGINIDVGSGKMKNLAADSKSLSSAQENLKYVQSEVAGGTLKGAAATQALYLAHQKVSDSSQKLALDQGTVKKVIGAVDDATKGAAHTYAQTFSGSLEVAKAKLENIGSSVGNVVLPALTKFVKIGLDVAAWVAKTKPLLDALAATIGVLLTGAMVKWIAQMVIGKAKAAIATAEAIIGYAKQAAAFAVQLASWVAGNAVMIAGYVAQAAAATAAFVAENAASLGIIAGIALLVGAIVYLATHWKQVWSDIKRYAEDAWHFIDQDVVQPIMRVFSDAINFIKAHWELLTEILLAPIAPVLAIFLKFHGDITKVFSDIVNGIVGFFTALPGQIVSVLGDLPGTIFASLKDAGTFIWNILSSLLTDYFVVWPMKAAAVMGDVVSIIFGALKSAGTWIYAHTISPVVDLFTALPGRIVSGLGNVIGVVWGGFVGAANWVDQQVITPVVNFFAGLPGAILKALGDVGKLLYNVGVAIIDGMVNGLKDAVHKVTDFMGSIVSKVKSIPVIGGLIGSPSPYFTTVGKAMMEGLSGGIASNAGLAHSALSAVTGSLTAVGSVGTAAGTAVAAAVAAPPSSSSGGGSEGGGSLTINLTMNGNQLATAMLPDLRQVLYMKKRGTVSMALT